MLRVCSERDIKEPRPQLKDVPFAKDVRKIITHHKQNLVKMMMVLDPSTIKHDKECGCIGCNLRRDKPGKSIMEGQTGLTPQEIQELREMASAMKQKQAQEGKSSESKRNAEQQPDIEVQASDDTKGEEATPEAATPDPEATEIIRDEEDVPTATVGVQEGEEVEEVTDLRGAVPAPISDTSLD